MRPWIGSVRRIAARLVFDQSADTAKEYLIAGIVLALVIAVIGRATAGILVSFFHRVYLVAALLIS